MKGKIWIIFKILKIFISIEKLQLFGGLNPYLIRHAKRIFLTTFDGESIKSSWDLLNNLWYDCWVCNMKLTIDNRSLRSLYHHKDSSLQLPTMLYPGYTLHHLHKLTLKKIWNSNAIKELCSVDDFMDVRIILYNFIQPLMTLPFHMLLRLQDV